MRKSVRLLLSILTAGLLLIAASGCDAAPSDPPSDGSANAADTTAAPADTSAAKTYKITWVLFDDLVIEEHPEGTVPTPPAVETTVITDTLTATFTGWDQEITAVSGDTVYRAKYDRKTHTYPVHFLVDGKEVASAETKYNNRPVFPLTELPEKEGLRFAFWTNSEAIKGETVCEAVFTKMNPEQLEWAYAQSLMGYSETGGDNSGSVLTESSALLYLVLEENTNPQSDRIRDRVLAHLRNLIAGGHEPYFDLEPYWNYTTLSAAIAVCKATPTVWDALTDAERAKLDCIMESFAYILTLGTADGNNYTTGPGRTGNFGKNWNPNYRLANVTPMIFVTDYFGSAEAVNTLLKNFSFDAHTARFKEYGFTRAYNRWMTEAPTLSDGRQAPSNKELMENGGTAYLGIRTDSSADRLNIIPGKEAGTGVGVRVEYKYKTFTLAEPEKIFNALLDNCYNGGKVINSYGSYADGSPKAYILGGGSSPVLGLEGMMLEFKSSDGGNGTDGGDIRSSCSYTGHDFVMVVASLAAMEALDIYDPMDEDNLDIFRRVWVGNADSIYKLEQGYMSYSLGKARESHESASDGYLLWKTWWNEKYGSMKYEDFPEPARKVTTVIDFEDTPAWNSNGIEISNYGETFGITESDIAHSGVRVLLYRTQNTYNRIRFLNLFDEESVGHEYSVSFWYYVENLPKAGDTSYENYFGVRTEQNIKSGKAGFAEQRVPVTETGKWIEYRYTFTYTAEMLADDASALVFRFSHLGQVKAKDATGTGGTYVTVMLDDITVTDLTEQAAKS